MQTYLEPTPESGRAFFMRGMTGSVVMLNLLRYRAIADYSASPQLAPTAPIAGEAAYRLYMDHTMPHLEKSGGKLLFFGQGGSFLIGPDNERWDAVMLVQQSSPAASWHLRRMPNTLQAWVTARPHWKTRACSQSRKVAGPDPSADPGELMHAMR